MYSGMNAHNQNQAQGHFQSTMHEQRGPDEAKSDSRSERMLTKNKLRSRIQDLIRKKKLPQRNHKDNPSKQLLASCLNKEELTCMICLELLLQSVLMPCGHSFCRSCIESLNLVSSQNRCSLCRREDQSPFYEPDRTTSKIMDILGQVVMTPHEQKEYKSRQRRLRKEMEKRGAQCHIRVHDQIKVRVKNSWLKAIVISIVKTKENIYYEVQTNTEEIFMVNCRSKNIIAKEQDLARSREMTMFLENTQNTNRTQPFREISNTYDIEDLLQVNTCPINSNPWGFPSQPHSSLFFDLQLHSLDGFISEVI